MKTHNLLFVLMLVFAFPMRLPAPVTSWPPTKGWPPKGADIASASTTDLATATGGRLNITGTATITSFGTVSAGTVFTLEFTGASGITYNGTSMITLTGASVKNKTGSVRVFESLGSGKWQELLNNISGSAAAIRIFSGSQALNTASVAAGACETDITVTATGVVSTDTVIMTPNLSWMAVTGYGVGNATDQLKVQAIPSTDTITIKVCNQTGNSTITPGAATVNLSVIR